MNTRLLQSVLKHAAAVANGSRADGDTTLLRKFAASRDPAAFAELVRRYGRLVWAVCRQLRPTDADAEDAFQATFLALLRSAGSIRTNALGPWLHTVAHRVACKAARTDGRRRKREQGAAAPDQDAAVPPSAWDALAAAVHEEVAKLPEYLRVPFVLCCLEGRGTTDAAKQLGWKLGTLSGRLTRAKQTLLDRLAKRGLPAAVVAVSLTATAVPATVAAKALDLIHLGDAIPFPILELAKGATTMTKTKLLAAGLLIAAGLMTGLGGWLATADAQAPPAAPMSNVPYLDRLFKNVGPVPEAKWEYHYHSLLYDKNGKPAGMKAADFEKLLETMEAEGWSYLGQADIVAMHGPPLPSHVFRRPKNDAAKAQMDRLYLLQLDRAQRLLGEKLPRVNPDVAEVRDVIFQRMRKDPKETFDSALATKLKVSPQLTAAVDAYGRTVLHVDVLSALLAEARQSSPTSLKSGASQAADGATRLRLVNDEEKDLELLVKKQQAEALLKEVAEAMKMYPSDHPKLELVRKKAQFAVKEVEEAKTRLGEVRPDAGGGTGLDADTVAVRKSIQEFRDRKTVQFTAADFGITGQELMTVLMKAIDRKFDPKTTPKPFDLTGHTDFVEVAGSPPNLAWLIKLMNDAKPKPTPGR